MRTTNPRGFSASEATFATSLFGPIPIEQPRPVARSISAREPPHRRVRGGQPGQLEVGLVEPDHLDRLHVRPHDRHHLARGLAVVGEVRRQEHPVGTQPPRAGRRDRRADAEAPRLVGGGRDHRARAAPGDDHRQSSQLRTPAQLDRHVERVHVEMGDAALCHCQTRLRPRPDDSPGRAGAAGAPVPGAPA